MSFILEKQLEFSARVGNSAEVKLLIAQGADPNGEVEHMGAPLFAALAKKNGDVVEILLSAGADVSIVDQFGDGPLEYALHHGDDHSVRILLGYNAKLREHAKDTYRKLLEESLKRTSVNRQ